MIPKISTLESVSIFSMIIACSKSATMTTLTVANPSKNSKKLQRNEKNKNPQKTNPRHNPFSPLYPSHLNTFPQFWWFHSALPTNY